MGSAKVQCSLWILWKKAVEGTSEFIEVDKVFHSNMTSVFQGTVVDEVLDTMFSQVRTHVENPALPKSGFTISRIMHIDVDFHKLRLTRGSSYIKAPKWILTKKAIINPMNEDEECFKWSIMSALHHEEIGTNPQRISKLEPYMEQYSWQAIEFPTSIKDISKFEKNNPDIAVNVLYLTGKTFNILRQSTHNGREKQVNLLLLTDDKKSHYIAIKNPSRLLGSETSKNHAKMHFCMNCLQAFPTIESKDKHYTYCRDNEVVKITLPSEKEKWLYYKDGQQQFKVPFAIYADFESLLVPMTEDKRETKTTKLNKHVPCGWCTYSTFAYGSVPDPLTVYRGDDCVKKFVDNLEDEIKRLYDTYNQQDMLPLTEVLKREHDSATNCHICMKPFDNDEYSRYDAHLFIRELGEKYDTQDIGCIAENTEKYISFNVKIRVPIADTGHDDGDTYKTIEIRFIDSCRFMTSSLDKLASNLIGKNTAGMKCQQCADTCLEFQRIDAKYVASFWCKNCDTGTTKQLGKEQVKTNVPSMVKFIDKDDVFRLMLQKSVYPYEYMDSWQRFKETELPPKEAFYSKLNMKGISDNNYKHAQKVWKCITLEGAEVNMGDYHYYVPRRRRLATNRHLPGLSRSVSGELQARSRPLLQCTWSRLESIIEVHGDQAGAPYGFRQCPDVREGYQRWYYSSRAQIC
ncbi:uncharacterized protein LOC130625168 [Hydractinia symbiolongicarpus]|uniref:uncharacterized protein LOC130625168 n=1 Tax=Hydractinia symbiolongicarpus TaxID=13093 RepID=UPI0025518915|nr:uncharacterized protein LOC130625168 [Hydractinia symbiolongicarpus]